MKTLEEVYTILDESLTAAKARGLTIVQRQFGDGKTTCCAVSSLPEGNRDCPVTTAASRLGISAGDLWDVIFGFDGVTSCIDLKWYTIGQRLVEKHLPSPPVL